MSRSLWSSRSAADSMSCHAGLAVRSRLAGYGQWSGLVLGTFSLLLLPRSSLLSPLEPAVLSALRRLVRLVWWTLAAALDTRASDGGCERASISICFTRSAALSTSPAEAFATNSRSGLDRPESWSILSAIVLVVLRNSASYSANIMKRRRTGVWVGGGERRELAPRMSSLLYDESWTEELIRPRGERHRLAVWPHGDPHALVEARSPSTSGRLAHRPRLQAAPLGV